MKPRTLYNQKPTSNEDLTPNLKIHGGIFVFVWGISAKIFISLSVPQAFILSFVQSVHHLVNI